MFLKNTLNEDLLAFTDQDKYKELKDANKTSLNSYEVNLEKPIATK
jgi:hypothetical protein